MREELSPWRHAAASRYITCFQTRATGETQTNPRGFRNKGPKQHVELTRETRLDPACLTNKSKYQTKFYPDWPVIDLNAVKGTSLSWSYGSSYEIGKSAILSTLTSKLPYACVYVCVLLRMFEY